MLGRWPGVMGRRSCGYRISTEDRGGEESVEDRDAGGGLWTARCINIKVDLKDAAKAEVSEIFASGEPKFLNLEGLE